MRSRSHPPSRLLAPIALAAVLCTAASCPQVFVDTPRRDQIVDDDAFDVTARVATALVESNTELRLDGVDLIDALGLVPPFANAGGVVAVGSQTVTVTDFDYVVATPTDQIRLTLSGLDETAHVLEVRGFTTTATLHTVQRPFSVSAPLVLAVEAYTAGGAPAKPLTGGAAFGTSLAPPWSAGRISFPDGSAIGTPVAGAAAVLAPGGTP